MSLYRNAVSQLVSVNTAIGTTEEIDFRNQAGGSVMIPAGFSTTELTWWGAHEVENASGVPVAGTYVAIYDDDAAEVDQDVTHTKGYPIPQACFGYAFLKIIGSHAEILPVIMKG